MPRRVSSFGRLAPLVAVALAACGGCEQIKRWTGRTEATPSPTASPVLQTTPTPTPEPTPMPFDKTVVAAMTPRAMDTRVPVLMFHDVVAERGRNSVWFDCTKDELKETIKFFEEQNATFITLEQLHEHLVRGTALPPHSVCLTFDDNYQGFFDNAYPILKAKKIPSAMFVHTKFVGDKTGTHPKMDYDTLRLLDKEGLVTIGSHTVSHPDDMALLPVSEQDEEITTAKADLERELGHPVPYFAYPNGKGDDQTFDAAMRAGHTMAFTIANGPAEESPGVLRINRYIHTRYKDAWKECEAATENAPAAVIDQKLTANPVMLTVADFAGVKLGLVRGGKPATWQTSAGRASVGEFVQMASQSGKLTEPAVAGMNGTFFADANLRGTGNAMIGPCITRADGVFVPEEATYRLPKIVNRPLVLWGPERLMIVPFNPYTMNDEAVLKQALPDMTDAFLAGAWIVHEGTARTREQMAAYSARDFNDPRRRAFFGITDSGDVVLGGSLDVITTEKLAQAAAAAGVKEAVLMDSGFSTSIVFDNKIIVTGHTAKNLPSRPVPHSIVLSGTLQAPTDAQTVKALAAADPAVGAISAAEAQAQAPKPEDGAPRRRRRSRR